MLKVAALTCAQVFYDVELVKRTKLASTTQVAEVVVVWNN